MSIYQDGWIKRKYPDFLEVIGQLEEPPILIRAPIHGVRVITGKGTMESLDFFIPQLSLYLIKSVNKKGKEVQSLVLLSKIQKWYFLPHCNLV